MNVNDLRAALKNQELVVRVRVYLHTLAAVETVTAWLGDASLPAAPLIKSLERATALKSLALDSLIEILPVGTTSLPGFLITYDGVAVDVVVIVDEGRRPANHQ